ncbi:MAG: guanylate kinase [Pseudomonadota bacterium]
MTANDQSASGSARRGVMFVISSPSGAGKTTLAKRLLDAEPALTLSISTTTRPMRSGEINGLDYIFSDKASFDQEVAKGAFLEHAEVHGNHYGTPRHMVETALKQGRDILFDIDWQGTQQLRKAMPEDVATVFILPPSLAELKRRLKSRALDTDAVVERRMSKARHEIEHWTEYDYVLVNDEVDECFRMLHSIFVAERNRRKRRNDVARLASDLLAPENVTVP